MKHHRSCFSIKPKVQTSILFVKSVKEIYGILSIQILKINGEIWFDEQDSYLMNSPKAASLRSEKKETKSK